MADFRDTKFGPRGEGVRLAHGVGEECGSCGHVMEAHEEFAPGATRCTLCDCNLIEISADPDSPLPLASESSFGSLSPVTRRSIVALVLTCAGAAAMVTAVGVLAGPWLAVLLGGLIAMVVGMLLAVSE